MHNIPPISPITEKIIFIKAPLSLLYHGVASSVSFPAEKTLLFIGLAAYLVGQYNDKGGWVQLLHA